MLKLDTDHLTSVTSGLLQSDDSLGAARSLKAGTVSAQLRLDPWID